MKKILYYYWGENSYSDCIEGLKALGVQTETYSVKMDNYTRDDRFLEGLCAKLRGGSYDAIFSFDYFPILSAAAQDAGILYLSWVYDSPHLTLYSNTLGNPCNRVFLFDYAQYADLEVQGFETVRYLPLPCNVARYDRLLAGKTGYLHDISFIGTLYDGADNFYRQIGYLPDSLRGYVEALMTAQKQIYGMDLLEELKNGDWVHEFAKHVNADLGPEYRDARADILMNMLRKEITARERREMLELLGNLMQGRGSELALYSGKKPEGLPARYCGIAENQKQMPEIFRRSRINLNSTLRGIQTGIPLRVIDIMGAGGFCLTNYQAELAEYFENGRDLVWYESPEDMREKAEYYLEHDGERERIAASGRERIAEGFTHERLLTRILEETKG